MASPGNALGAALNTSSLHALETWSLSYSHVASARGTGYPTRYDGVYLASPLGSNFALGTGLDFYRAGDEQRGLNGFVLGAAIGAGPRMSFGGSWRMRSPRGGGADVHSADLSLTVRPVPTIAVSLIARDLAPRDRALGYAAGAPVIEESGLLAIALHPLGDDRFMLELAGRADASGDLGLRAATQVMVPYVGRLGVGGELSEASGRAVWTLTAGLDVRFGQLSVAPAVHMDERADAVGWSLLADVHGAPRIGVPAPRYVAKLEVKGGSARGQLRTLRALDHALHDPRVEGVILEIDGLGGGLAAAQELRMMIEKLERADKPVYCFLEAASGSEYYACSSARRRSIDPAGMVRLMGVGGEALYLGELLRKVGLRADFIRIGRYKSAPEQYTNDRSSDEAREVRTSLLDSAYARLVGDLVSDRGESEASVRALIDRGPFLAEEALRERLVDATLDRRDVSRDAKVVFGDARYREPSPEARDPRFGPTAQIGVVVVDGTIVDGDNIDVPFVDVHMSGGHTVAKAIDRLTDDSRIRAIVLRIDSPGGAVMASDQIWRAVKRARAKKPVIASMGGVAASGGYYAALGANEIFALPSTITGSIGVFYGKVDLAPLANMIGVSIESDARGAHAGADSLFRPFDDEERAALADKVRIWYRQFLERVAEGRRIPLERADALARGRVYSGEQAHANGLVDKLGDFTAALARARELAGLGPEAELVVVPKVPSTLLDYVLGGPKVEASPQPVPSAMKPLLQQLYFWTRISGLEPLALYEGPLRLE